MRRKYAGDTAGHDLISMHSQAAVVGSHPLRIEQCRHHSSAGYQLRFIQAMLLDHILQADLVAHQNLRREIDGKSLRQLLFVFGTVRGYQEAYHPCLLGMALTG